MAELKRSLRKLQLLLWKQYHLRKYRWIISAMELFLPILSVLSIANMFKSILSDAGVTKQNATIYNPETIDRILRAYGTSYTDCSVYTPAEQYLEVFMHQRYKEYLRYVRSDIERDRILSVVENESKLEKYLRGSNRSCVGIIFTNFSALVDPEVGRLSYTLRKISDLDTVDVYYSDDENGPMRHNALANDAYMEKYLVSGLAHAEIALNDAFMNYTNTSAIYYNSSFKIQAFPYPEYEKENASKALIMTAVCVIILFTSVILSVTLIPTIIEERSSGVKELMKIVGIQEWLIWVGWFLYALVFSSISYSVVTYLLQFDFTGPNSAPLRNINSMVLWTFIILYYVANVTFTFMFSAIFHHTTIASSMFFLLFVLIAIGSCAFLSKNKYAYLREVACLLPNAAFCLGFDRIRFSEFRDAYLSWHNLFSASPSSLSLGFIFLMLIFDTFLYLFLVYYISAVNPGKFGARKSPFFIFYPFKSALKMNKPKKVVNLEDQSVDRYIEKAPSNLEATIKIQGLHKNFGSVYAVRGVNLNVYKGEITALLGHNGAGKTTTLAILTGIVKPTAGSIMYKDKLDVLKRMGEFRENLGMCAQEDRLFSYLSVLDHLLFFGQLKGATKQAALKEAREYMKLMEIDDKAKSKVASLSGGMKRKLCLSIALMGKAETLILDEPTSGLDVESRRKLWDLLLKMRGSRTIILTTHHMEEADALGDRIAIMNHGTIVCHGTSLYLKKSFNAGYEVTITKTANVSEASLTSTLQSSQVAAITVEDSSPTEITYKLPLTETSKFPTLFALLEADRTKLGIESIGVSCTTMEQVFLKVGEMSVYDSLNMSRNRSTLRDSGRISAATRFVYNKRSGPLLIAQQMYALFYKKLLYTWRDWLNFLFKVLLPTLFMISIMMLLNDTKKDHSKSLPINFAMYPNTAIMVQNTSESWSTWQSFQPLLHPYGVELIASQGKNITDGLLKYARADLESFKHDIILAMEKNNESNEKAVTLLFNPFALHSLPLGLNLFANNWVQNFEKRRVEFEMTAYPLSEGTISCSNHGIGSITDTALVASLYFFVFGFYTIDLNTYFMTAINVERLDGFKHIQLMSNVSPLTYWLSNFIFDYLTFCLIIFVRFMTLKIVDDAHEFLMVDDHLFALISILAIYIASSLVFTYVVSYLSNSTDGSYLLLFVGNVIGAVTVFIFYKLSTYGIEEELVNTGWTIVYRVVEYLILLLPPLNYTMIFFKSYSKWLDVKQCTTCLYFEGMEIICEDLSYFNGVKRELKFLAFDGVLYTVLLSVIQMGYFEKLVNMTVIMIYGSSVASRGKALETGDKDVQLEKTAVNNLTSAGKKSLSKMVLVVHQLRKNFIKSYRPFTAVADVNFTVKAGECFGLLGVNGAGKSSTFKMLTGAMVPTKGDSSIMGFTLRRNRTEYLSRAGYCAQSNCFLEELSGREMLSLVASLRGIRSAQVEKVVDKWISILGLKEYQNEHCGGYSGGNKRKLCTAMSLIGDPNVVFLDEPTSGVDPVARRRLYIVMEQSRLSGQAVVLTSHSMDECETLCDRLTILVKGRMQCIGTAQHLKQLYAQGFTVLVKIKDATSVDDLKRLKTRITGEFNQNCVLKDEHRTQLYYQITDTRLLWSTLFEKMEKLKNENKNVIEDYILTDTSLEEVFISFAKQST